MACECGRWAQSIRAPESRPRGAQTPTPSPPREIESAHTAAHLLPRPASQQQRNDHLQVEAHVLPEELSEEPVQGVPEEAALQAAPLQDREPPVHLILSR